MSLPFGADCCGVLDVLEVFPAEGAAAAGAVVVWELAGFSEVLGDDAAVSVFGVSAGAASAGAGAGASTGGGGAGGGAIVGLIGLIGLIGLVTLVGLVIDLVHEFCVSIHCPATGCP